MVRAQIVTVQPVMSQMLLLSIQVMKVQIARGRPVIIQMLLSIRVSRVPTVQMERAQPVRI